MFRILTVFLSCSLLLLAAAQEFPEDTVLEELDTDEQSSFDPKANWPAYQEEEEEVLPVSGLLVRETRDVASVSESKTTPEPDTPSSTVSTVVVDTVAVTSSSERAGVDCPSTAERGLPKLIRNAREILPVEELSNILSNALNDPEVRQLVELLNSSQFIATVERLRATEKHQLLQDFGCKRLHLNSGYYIEFVRLFLNVHLPNKPSKPLPTRRRGIRGLLQDLRDALPRRQLRELYNRQVSKDSELITAVRLIRSKEFRRLLQEYRMQREYREVRDALERVGVPLQQVQQLVSNSLGWSNLDMGSEVVIWTV